MATKNDAEVFGDFLAEIRNRLNSAGRAGRDSVSLELPELSTLLNLGGIALNISAEIDRLSEESSVDLLDLVLTTVRAEAKRRVPSLIKRVCVLHKDLRVVRLRDQEKVRDAIQLLIQRGELVLDLNMDIVCTRSFWRTGA